MTAWDWQELGPNHFCDCATGCFALASWFHAYDNLSLVIDGVLTAGSTPQPVGDEIAPHTLHQDDLFDPMKNAAITNAAATPAAYDGKTDETEGTGDDGVEPYKGDVMDQSDPFASRHRFKMVTPINRLINRISKRVYKFKRGKWRK